VDKKVFIPLTLATVALAATGITEQAEGTHQLNLATTSHTVWFQGGGAYIVLQYGEDGGHGPQYADRAYSFGSAVYQSGASFERINVSAGFLVSCNNGLSWQGDTIGAATGEAVLSVSAFSGGWAALPDCDAYPKYAVDTYHYFRAGSNPVQYAEADCYHFDERYWFQPCQDFAQEPPPGGGGGRGWWF